MARRRSITNRATAADVERQATKWTDQQLMCRAEVHRFTVGITAHFYQREGYYYIVEGCEGNCGVRRISEMDTEGHRYYSRPDYSHADNYLMEPGTGRVYGAALDEVRRQKIVRLMKVKTIKSAKPPHAPSKRTR